VLASAFTAAADTPPRRVVSLNLCTDELLLRLAPREHIASITWLGKDARRSTVAARAAGIPANRGLAEEVIGLNPDLVLANAYSARPAIDFLKRQGIGVRDLAIPESFADMREQILGLADALGEREQGESLIADMDARLAAHTPVSADRPKAVMLGPNGFATSYSPLLNEVFALAGLDNLAAGLGTPDRAGIPIERVLLAGVDILVIEESGRGPALADELLRHPAIVNLKKRVTVVELPSRFWTCAGPQLADAVDVLAKARAGRK
jgi:iron complex transport system substrate-binding protein